MKKATRANATALRSGLLAGDTPMVYIASTRTGHVAFGVRATAATLSEAREIAQREYTRLRDFVQKVRDDELEARLALSVKKVNGEKA